MTDANGGSIGDIEVQIVKRPKKKVYRIPPLQFDLKPEEYDRVKRALVKVVSLRSNVRNPVAHAESILKRCLEGRRKDGKTVWFGAPQDLTKRLRIFGFDLPTMSGVISFGVKESVSLHKGSRNIKKIIDKAEVRINEDGEYEEDDSPLDGDDKFNVGDAKEYDKRVKNYLRHFPYLNNPADLSVLDLLVRSEIISSHRLAMAMRSKNLSSIGKGIDKDMADNIRKLQETLGIAGNQRMKLMGNITSGSVADLVKRFEDYTKDGKYLEIEYLWWKEEAALLLRKADRTFPNGVPEMEDAVFQRLMGVGIKIAREIIKDPYSRTLNESRQKAMELIKQRSEKSVVQKISRMGIDTDDRDNTE